MRALFKICATAAIGAVFNPAYAADWSDTELQLLHGSKFHETSNAVDVVKSILTLNHASAYKYGRNNFFVDILKSNGSDNNSGEVYSEFYTTLSMAKLGGLDWSQHGVKDIGATAGINFGSKSDSFGANRRVLLLGPTIDFDVPGFLFLNVSLLAYRDSSTSVTAGHLCGSKKTTLQVTPTWSLPFSIGDAKFSFEGYADYIAKHGTCAKQALAQPQLRWDIGHHLGKPGTVFVGIEYQYWKNKYGDRTIQEHFPQLLLVWKL